MRPTGCLSLSLGLLLATAEQVRAFVDELRSAKITQTRDTKSMNKNYYRRSKSGNNAEAVIELDGKQVPLTSDFLAH